MQLKFEFEIKFGGRRGVQFEFELEVDEFFRGGGGGRSLSSSSRPCSLSSRIQLLPMCQALDPCVTKARPL